MLPVSDSKKKRNLEYNGLCVEVVPDIPEVIHVLNGTGAEAKADVARWGGGTVGEYQNVLFWKRFVRMKSEEPENVACRDELSTGPWFDWWNGKPNLQTTCSYPLNNAGVFADMIVCRSPIGVDDKA